MQAFLEYVILILSNCIENVLVMGMIVQQLRHWLLMKTIIA